MAFLRNRWYAAVWSHELAPGPQAPAPVGRKILGEDIVFYRTATGKVAALSNLCPHRFAPLEYGVVVGDNIKCRYHGLQFNAEGKCAHDPSGAKPPPMSVKSYPLSEKDGMIYVWIGEGAPNVDAPDVLNFGPSFGGILRGHLHVKANYKLMIDNIMDDAHATHLHTLLKTEGHIARPKAEIVDEGETVRVNVDVLDTSVIPLFRSMYRKPGNVDQRVGLTWNAPCFTKVKSVICEKGGDPDLSVGVDSAHIFTPETETSCFYFWSFGRNANLEDHAFTEKMSQMLRHIFSTEDIWMVEGQQRMLGGDDFWDRKPALLAQDKAATLVRKRLEKLVSQQDQPKVAAE